MGFAWIPNAITVLRIVLVVPVAIWLWRGDYAGALVLTFIAGVSDALDGWLARRMNWTSQFGAGLDPVADKLLVAAMFVVFTLQGHIPLWVAVIVLCRDALILAGAGAYRLLFEPIEFAPTFVSKANTAMQIVTLLLLLVALCDFGRVSSIVGGWVDPNLFVALAVLGLVSGADYVKAWSGKAWAHGKARRNRG